MADARTCSKCREHKGSEHFHVDRSRPGGFGYVCIECRRATPEGIPNRRDRREARSAGLAWCRECKTFLPLAEMTKQGLCLEHNRQENRNRYARDEAFRERRMARSVSYRRKVERVPKYARQYMTELFGGICAYCDSPAETWDHVLPVTKGGITEAGNILPACIRCNSSKKNHELDQWLARTGRTLRVEAVEHLSLHGAL